MNLTGKSVVFFGDDHDMNSGRNWLARQIKTGQLKPKFLAIEYIETDQQSLIDKLDKKVLCSYISEKYKEFPGLNAESIYMLIKVAKENGIEVRGVEMPDKYFTDWKTEMAQSSRIEYITDQIQELTEIGDGIILLGADHVEKNKTNVFGKIFLANNNEKISVIFIGGKSWSIDTEEYWIRRLELDAIAKNKSLDYFETEVQDQSSPCHWIIHFPQVEKVIL